MKILIAPDKFRGTMTSQQFIDAVSEIIGARHELLKFVVSDGGDGLIEALKSEEVALNVHDALMRPTQASFGYVGNGDAVVEMARASGLSLVGGIAGNDPMQATTFGTGELMRAAILSGATRIIVGCGGSATTDGGLGALEALGDAIFSSGVTFIALSDVRIKFKDAAREFGPQKGASAEQVLLLEQRLIEIANGYAKRYGRDPSDVVGSGAAGGLAGMIYAIGGEILDGFDFVSKAIGLEESLQVCDAVITGEGKLDLQSLNGKVVGSLIDLAKSYKKRILVVCGTYEADDLEVFQSEYVKVVSLSHRFGQWLSLNDPVTSLKNIIAASDVTRWLD